jgi:hypothetical protein
MRGHIPGVRFSSHCQHWGELRTRIDAGVPRHHEHSQRCRRSLQGAGPETRRGGWGRRGLTRGRPGVHEDAVGATACRRGERRLAPPHGRPQRGRKPSPRRAQRGVGLVRSHGGRPATRALGTTRRDPPGSRHSRGLRLCRVFSQQQTCHPVGEGKRGVEPQAHAARSSSFSAPSLLLYQNDPGCHAPAGRSGHSDQVRQSRCSRRASCA